MADFPYSRINAIESALGGRAAIIAAYLEGRPLVQPSGGGGGGGGDTVTVNLKYAEYLLPNFTGSGISTATKVTDDIDVAFDTVNDFLLLPNPGIYVCDFLWSGGDMSSGTSPSFDTLVRYEIQGTGYTRAGGQPLASRLFREQQLGEFHPANTPLTGVIGGPNNMAAGVTLVAETQIPANTEGPGVACYGYLENPFTQVDFTALAAGNDTGGLAFIPTVNLLLFISALLTG